MKRLITVLIPVVAAFVFVSNMFAQSPERMSYQAVIRDASNNLVVDQSVGMQISILQGSVEGTSVFKERQFPVTNSNGLISIEIGAGTLVSGDFSGIDWSNGPYFIKTETDLNGGANYTITGTSQLVSVPYALYAKTADKITGDITETDPVYSASEAVNITSSDIVNLGNLSGTNSGDQDISGIATNTKAIQDTASQIRADIPSLRTYSVGDFAHGGIVFWVDESGQHGLVCAKTDQDGGSGIKWSNGSQLDTEAHGDGVFAGKLNTLLIVAKQGSNSNDYAAGLCANLKVTEFGVAYGDWYLPSEEELKIMWQNRTVIDATATANDGSSFTTGGYWSSTESTNVNARAIYFPSGTKGNYTKIYEGPVRAIRAF